MGRVVHAARGLAHRVRSASRVGAVRQARQHRGQAHVVASFQVVSLGKRDPQVSTAIVHRQQGNRVGERLVIGHRVALDGVSESIHPGSGCDRRGQVYRERGVDQCHPGGDVRGAADVELDLSVGVGDHRPEGDLAPGSSRGRNRDQRRDA